MVVLLYCAWDGVLSRFLQARPCKAGVGYVFGFCRVLRSSHLCTGLLQPFEELRMVLLLLLLKEGKDSSDES